MGERKSHVKSRLGCIQCKARRVKCDEKHPTCSNCKRRQESCSYRNPTPSIASPPDPGSISQPNGASNSPQAHIKQLELMHQFASDTYATLAIRPHGPITQQFELPKLAFENAFLLDTVFAITSLHLAYLRPNEAQWRIADAARYQAQAIAATRQRVAKLEASECRAMYHCSSQLGVIALAFRAVDFDSADASTPSETLRQLSQLWRGTWSILLASRELISPEDYDMFFPPPGWALAPDQTLTPVLDSFLDMLRTKAKSNPGAKNVIVPFGPGVSMEDDGSTGCLVAIGKLQILFQLCDPEPSRILAWLVEVPQSFWELVSERDPLASAVVLLYSITYRNLEDHWWAKGIRHQLADELSPIVAMADPELAEIAKWIQSNDWPDLVD
ncbi:putative zn(2)-C6 fungal-type DNA-binding domain-containing protein [Septoria linicola]|nr:putative zn(2)-C6 fungal-type DNA-binding domain-containing protein [Septoria linicola]